MSIYKVIYTGTARKYAGFETEVSATSAREAVIAVCEDRLELFEDEDGSIRDCDGDTLMAADSDTLEYDGGVFCAQLVSRPTGAFMAVLDVLADTLHLLASDEPEDKGAKYLSRVDKLRALGCWERFLANCKALNGWPLSETEQFLATAESSAKATTDAFCWKETPEGVEYWNATFLALLYWEDAQDFLKEL